MHPSADTAASRRARNAQDARAKWQSHLNAQRSSGLSQAAYCREQGLNAKYFSIWKGKLKSLINSSAGIDKTATDLRLIPVIVKPAKVRAPMRASDAKTAMDLMLKATLCNGVVVDVQAQSMDALLPLFVQLAQLPC